MKNPTRFIITKTIYLLYFFLPQINMILKIVLKRNCQNYTNFHELFFFLICEKNNHRLELVKIRVIRG